MARTYTVGDLPQGWHAGAHCSPGTYGWAGPNAGWWIIRNRDGAAIQMCPQDEFTLESMNEFADAAARTMREADVANALADADGDQM